MDFTLEVKKLLGFFRNVKLFVSVAQSMFRQWEGSLILNWQRGVNEIWTRKISTKIGLFCPLGLDGRAPSDEVSDFT